MAGAPLELLPDCASLARWLKAAGLLSKREGKRLERKWSARPAFAGMVRELREFREELRQTVLEMEAGAPPPAAFIAKANELLSAHPYIDELVQTNSRLDREKRFE